jgi:hypothetical protein
MACWYVVSLQWVECAPGPAQCECLNEDLHKLDYDCPKVTPAGLNEARWRSPLLTLKGFSTSAIAASADVGKLTRYDPDGEDLGLYALHDHESNEGWTSSITVYHEKFSVVMEPFRLRRSRFERI